MDEYGVPNQKKLTKTHTATNKYEKLLIFKNQNSKHVL